MKNQSEATLPPWLQVWSDFDLTAGESGIGPTFHSSMRSLSSIRMSRRSSALRNETAHDRRQLPIVEGWIPSLPAARLVAAYLEGRHVRHFLDPFGGMGLFPLLLSRHIAMDEGAALIPGATARLASRLDSASSVRFESEVFSTSSYAKTGSTISSLHSPCSLGPQRAQPPMKRSGPRMRRPSSVGGSGVLRMRRCFTACSGDLLRMGKLRSSCPRATSTAICIGGPSGARMPATSHSTLSSL